MINDHSDPEANIDELFRLSESIDTLGKDWADKQHAANLLEETKTIVRAEIANRIRSEHPHMTRRDAEIAALVSAHYRDHVNSMVNAKRDANIARVNLEAVRARFEAMRTAEVSRRAEVTRFQSR